MFPMQAQIYIQVICHSPTRAILAPVNYKPQVGAGTPSPCTSADSIGGSGLEGGRKLGLLL